MLTGSDVRQYRRAIGLGQVEFAKRLNVSQSNLSFLEGGRISVSERYVERLKAAFPAPKYQPSFEEFLRDLERGAALRQAALTTSATHHSTLTVWKWTEDFSLSRQPAADLAADLIMVRGLSEPAIALQMPNKTTWWQKGEMLVFERCGRDDVADGEVCLAQIRAGKSKSSQTLIAAARLGPAKRGKTLQLEPILPTGAIIMPADDALLAILRCVYRARRIIDPPR